jgi:NADH dehydrogenase/NADH:ubiquinone oxidoreductase subunit G
MSTSTSEVVTPVTPATDPATPVVVEPIKAVEPKDLEAEVAKWRAMSRKHESDSKANADKAKAFDALEEANKSEIQKMQDAATKADAKTASIAAELALTKAAVKHGLTEDDMELLGTHGTPEEIDARAEKLAARIKAAVTGRPLPDTGGGARGGNVSDKQDFDTQIAAATAAGNFQRAILLKQQKAVEAAKTS